MHTIARRLLKLLVDHGWIVSAILWAFIGGLFGVLYDPRAPTHTVPARGDGLYPGNRYGWHALARKPHYEQEGGRHSQPPAIPTIVRAVTPPDVSLRAPSVGFSPFPSNVRSAPASESGLVELHRSTLRGVP
jgi:hypothetical protein